MFLVQLECSDEYNSRYDFPGDTYVVVSVNDILLLCKGMSKMQDTENVLCTLSCGTRLTISDRTKYQARTLEQKKIIRRWIKIRKS